MRCGRVCFALSCALSLPAALGSATDPGGPSGIHLNINYPKDAHSGNLDVDTGDHAHPSEFKTPVVIIAPKPLLDYERLYKKMMDSVPRSGGRSGRVVGGVGNVEKEILYDEKTAYSDPVSRRQLLFELLKDAEADLAFYRADYSEMELVSATLDLRDMLQLLSSQHH